MTRIDGMLLERMTIRRWCVAIAVTAIGFGGVGYVAGRAHVQSQLRDAVQTSMTKATTDLEAWGKRYTEEKAKQRRERGE